MLTLLGGVAQINPSGSSAPPTRPESPPRRGHDWYLAFLDGLVRLAPPWSFDLFGATRSRNALALLLFPAVAAGILTLWPWMGSASAATTPSMTLLAVPAAQDAPLHTVGAAGLTMFLVAFLAAGNDILANLLYLRLEAVTRLLQWLFVLGPVVVGLVTYAVCRSLRRSGLHPARATPGCAWSAPPAAATGPPRPSHGATAANAVSARQEAGPGLTSPVR